MNQTILLVEDDVSDVFFMKRALKRAGVLNPLQVASNGQCVKDYLAGNGEYSDRIRFPVPALIVLDLMLPLVSGLEVLTWVRGRAELKSVIVVILTSSNLPPDIIKAYLLGANGYFVKPSSPLDLPRVVTMIQHDWLARAETNSGCGPAHCDQSSPPRLKSTETDFIQSTFGL